MTVRIAFLGGLGEIGRNCASIEIDGSLALLDVGLMFPEEDMLGVDLVLPDFSSVLDRADDLECVILTHGHEDHAGALAYLLREANVPVYGTPLSLELARSRVEELGVAGDLRHTEYGEWVDHGPFRFAFIQVSHSVPQAAGVVFDTPEGFIVHSGDFKLDPTPIDGRPTDLPTFAGFGRRGVRLLLSDSTNAEQPGITASESALAGPLTEIVAGASGRVIVACFASHVHRVQQVIDAVAASGRTMAFLGRSMLRNTEVASELGLLRLPPGRVVDIADVDDLAPERTAVICTGSQGEPFAALSLMAAGEHRTVTLGEGDTVIISATPIPGNETKVSRVINNLYRLGVRVFHGRNARVHASGHAAAEELKTFMNVVRPQAFVPVHGEYRHLVAHAALARQMRVPEVFVCEDGDVLVLENGSIRRDAQAVPAGYVYLDGTGIGDIEEVLRDRRHLADDGIIIVTIGVDAHSGEILIGPDVDSHGVADDPKELHALVAASVAEGVAAIEERPLDLDTLRRRVRNRARKAVQREARRRPVVFPVVLEL